MVPRVSPKSHRGRTSGPPRLGIAAPGRRDHVDDSCAFRRSTASDGWPGTSSAFGAPGAPALLPAALGCRGLAARGLPLVCCFSVGRSKKVARIRLASQMPRKGGNRAAQEAGSMRSAKQEGGSTGGRCAAASSSKGPRKQPVGRPKNKPSAEPLVRPRSSRRRMPARQPACSGDPLSCPLSFVLSSLTSLFMQQAE